MRTGFNCQIAGTTQKSIIKIPAGYSRVICKKNMILTTLFLVPLVITILKDRKDYFEWLNN